MSNRVRLMLVIAVLVFTSACKLVFPDATPTPAPEIFPASATPGEQPGLAPSETPAPTTEVEPEASPTTRATRRPASTPVRATATAESSSAASATPDVTGGLDLGLPGGEPLAEWHEIPIMPGAIAGDADEAAGMYTFTIKATIKEVQDYYKAELKKLGFEPFATGDTEAETLILMFSNANNDMIMLTTLENIAGDGVTMVMIGDMR